MAKPRKSTFDAFMDQFSDFDLDTQERVIEMAEFVHRQARRKAGRKPRGEETAPPQPAAEAATAAQPSLTGLPDESQGDLK